MSMHLTVRMTKNMFNSSDDLLYNSHQLCMQTLYTQGTNNVLKQGGDSKMHHECLRPGFLALTSLNSPVI